MARDKKKTDRGQMIPPPPKGDIDIDYGRVVSYEKKLLTKVIIKFLIPKVLSSGPKNNTIVSENVSPKLFFWLDLYYSATRKNAWLHNSSRSRVRFTANWTNSKGTYIFVSKGKK